MESILLRSVVEFSNICLRNCAYCGLRHANHELSRYRLEPVRVLSCVQRAHSEGIQVVMLQSGDDLQYDLRQLCLIVETIRERFGLTVLLCVGDRSLDFYRSLYRSGATQTIVKFETSNAELYKKLRPHSTLAKRLRLIENLVEIGFDVSSGFIFGLPGASARDHDRDLQLLKQMPLFASSISPFIPNHASPLMSASPPSLVNVLDAIGALCSGCPERLVPAVSALKLLSDWEGKGENGQLSALKRGANVLTVNLTPSVERLNYIIYDPARFTVSLEYARSLVAAVGRRVA